MGCGVASEILHRIHDHQGSKIHVFISGWLGPSEQQNIRIFHHGESVTAAENTLPEQSRIVRGIFLRASFVHFKWKCIIESKIVIVHSTVEEEEEEVEEPKILLRMCWYR